MMKHIYTAIIAILIVIVGSPVIAQQGVTDTKLVIGTMIPQSGPLAGYSGLGVGMQSYVNYINKNGGIHGRQIELVIADNAGKPTRSLASARRLVEKDQIFAMVGGYDESAGLIAKEYFMKKGVPWIFPAYAVSDFIKDSDSFVPLEYAYFDQAYTIAGFIATQYPGKKIGIMSYDDRLGAQMIESAQMALREKNVQPVIWEKISWAASDMSPHIQNLKKSGAEVVILWVAGKHAILSLTTGRLMKYRPLWATASFNSDYTAYKRIARGAWENVIFADQYTVPDTDPLFDPYRKILRDSYPHERWTSITGSGVLFMATLANVIEQAGKDITPETFVEAARSFEKKDLFFIPVNPDQFKDGIMMRHMTIRMIEKGGALRELVPSQKSKIDVRTFMKHVHGQSQ